MNLRTILIPWKSKGPGKTNCRSSQCLGTEAWKRGRQKSLTLELGMEADDGGRLICCIAKWRGMEKRSRDAQSSAMMLSLWLVSEMKRGKVKVIFWRNSEKGQILALSHTWAWFCKGRDMERKMTFYHCKDNYFSHFISMASGKSVVSRDSLYQWSLAFGLILRFGVPCDVRSPPKTRGRLFCSKGNIFLFTGLSRDLIKAIVHHLLWSHIELYQSESE